VAIVQDLRAKQLVFSATTWNNGDGPLVLVADEPTGLLKIRIQRVFLSDGTFDRLAGTFVASVASFPPEECLYTLQRFDVPADRNARARKRAFASWIPVDTAARRPVAVCVTCGNHVGMSAGWGDTYGSRLRPIIDLTRLPDGLQLHHW
jgi:hypothetical protein